MMLWSLCFANPLFPSITTELEDGVVIDWTRSELQITVSAERAGSEGTRGLEELARRSVDLQMTGAALKVPVAPAVTLDSLRRSSEVWTSLEPRVGRWRETENRYYASGRVEVVGALSLVDLLKPYVMQRATPHQGGETQESGVLVDARGLEATPCFAPKLMAGNTCLLYTSPSPRDRTRSRMPSSA